MCFVSLMFSSSPHFFFFEGLRVVVKGSVEMAYGWKRFCSITIVLFSSSCGSRIRSIGILLVFVE